MSRLLVLVVVLGLLGVPGPAGRSGPVPAHGAATGMPVPVPVGAFGWPVSGVDPTGPPAPGAPGRVTRRFLAPPTPYGRGHRGVDLAAGPGTPVLAAGSGTVAFAGTLAGRGVVSVVHAGGLRTTYEPVTPAVAVGAVVARGEPVGLLAAGHRGCPGPACLHWGLRAAAPGGEVYLDPLLLLGLARIRLLPWGPGP